MRLTALKSPIALALASITVGCSTTSPFSEKAYEQATSLKVEALATMDRATEPFPTQKQAIEALSSNIEKAYEYAKGRPHNEETTGQWEIIKDPKRNSLGGFLAFWKKNTVLGTHFIGEAKIIVSDGFDTIIELESGKRKK
ncbi:MAG: hypothetical protein E2602_05910 [Achromobacter sp.]|nr:hypothetical protein [Achromobacter sp.]